MAIEGYGGGDRRRQEEEEEFIAILEQAREEEREGGRGGAEGWRWRQRGRRDVGCLDVCNEPVSL